MRPPGGRRWLARIGVGSAADARSDWRKQWRFVIALESLLNCAAHLFGALAAPLVWAWCGYGCGCGCVLGMWC